MIESVRVEVHVLVASSLGRRRDGRVLGARKRWRAQRIVGYELRCLTNVGGVGDDKSFHPGWGGLDGLERRRLRGQDDRLDHR